MHRQDKGWSRGSSDESHAASPRGRRQRDMQSPSRDSTRDGHPYPPKRDAMKEGQTTPDEQPWPSLATTAPTPATSAAARPR